MLKILQIEEGLKVALTTKLLERIIMPLTLEPLNQDQEELIIVKKTKTNT